MLKLFRKLPYIGTKIKIIKPNIEDVLFEFYNKEDQILFIDVGANIGQTIDFIKKKILKYYHIFF